MGDIICEFGPWCLSHRANAHVVNLYTREEEWIERKFEGAWDPLFVAWFILTCWAESGKTFFHPSFLIDWLASWYRKLWWLRPWTYTRADNDCIVAIELYLLISQSIDVIIYSKINAGRALYYDVYSYKTTTADMQELVRLQHARFQLKASLYIGNFRLFIYSFFHWTFAAAV